MADAPGVKSCVVLRRTGSDVPMQDGRDHWWHELVASSDDPASCPCEPMDSEDLLFLMYTSGTTAKPKGIVHTTAGYLVGAVDDAPLHLRPEAGRRTCTGAPPTSAGSPATATSSTGRSATGRRRSCTRARPTSRTRTAGGRSSRSTSVTILYTAPTAIRSHMKWGPEYAQKHDLSSLRLLGSVGEPINPEAWIWYREHIGGDRMPDRRHVVADRDRDDPDHAAAGHHDAEAGLGDAAVPRRRRRRSTTSRARRSAPAGAAISS